MVLFPKWKFQWTKGPGCTNNRTGSPDRGTPVIYWLSILTLACGPYDIRSFCFFVCTPASWPSLAIVMCPIPLGIGPIAFWNPRAGMGKAPFRCFSISMAGRGKGRWRSITAGLHRRRQSAGFYRSRPTGGSGPDLSLGLFLWRCDGLALCLREWR